MYDKAIVNPDFDLELSGIMTEILQEYRAKHQVMEKRDYCYVESNTFAYYLNKEYPDIKVEVKETLFTIDDPIKLPLDTSDLKSKEFSEFMRKYDKKLLRGLTKRELSQLIYDFLVEYHNGVPADLFYFNHAYLLIEDGLIVDLTQKQFSKAVVGPITADKYI